MDDKPDINEMAMASILEERGSVSAVDNTFLEMCRHYGIDEAATARIKAREILKMVGL